MTNPRTPTIYDVAERAGVSASTVSRALANTHPVAVRTRRRIEAAVEELGYRYNHVARSLALRSTESIAILLPDLTLAFFPELVRHIQLRAEERGYSLILCNTLNDAGRELAYLDFLRGKRVDGVLVVGLGVHIDALAQGIGDLPVVCLDPDVNLPGAPMVQVDNRGGARAATQHLIDLGHRRIAHITGVSTRTVTRERLQGYRLALRRAGITPDPALVVSGDFTEEGGRRATSSLLELDVPPTAIFAANDQTAIGALAALRDHGIEVPHGVSVVGFDDIHVSAHIQPPLTTIREPVSEIANTAIDLLLERIRSREAGQRRVRLSGLLVPRGSTAPPPGV